jgi:hypothetical protein
MSALDAVRRTDRSVAAGLGAVVVHLALTGSHGAAHLSIPVEIAGWQAVYAGVVLVAAPLAGAGLLVRGRRRPGAWLLLAAGLAALGFEGALHFFVAGPDNVASVAHGAGLFRSTAMLTTAGDALLATTGAALVRRHRQGSSATPATVSKT